MRDRLAQALADEATAAELRLVLGDFLDVQRVGTGEQADVNSETLVNEFVRGCRVAKLPLGAVTAALDNFRAGATVSKGWKPAYRPLPQQVAIEGKAVLEGKRLRLAQYNRVLNAVPVPDPPTEEDRKAVADKLAEYHASLRPQSMEDRPPPLGGPDPRFFPVPASGPAQDAAREALRGLALSAEDVARMRELGSFR